MEGSGLKKETLGALTYLLGPITGVFFLIVEKDPFVKFHAMQSIVVLGGLIVVGWMLPLTIVLIVLTPIVWILWFILWLALIYKALKGEEWEVPYVGRYVRQLASKV